MINTIITAVIIMFIINSITTLLIIMSTSCVCNTHTRKHKEDHRLELISQSAILEGEQVNILIWIILIRILFIRIVVIRIVLFRIISIRIILTQIC